MRNKRLIIIIALVILVIVIAILIHKNKKQVNTAEVAKPELTGEIKTLDNVKYKYDEDANKYIVYDENNNELGTVVSESEVKKYVDNPDYDVSKRPAGFSESREVIEEEMERIEDGFITE